jgi:hypothetical protein
MSFSLNEFLFGELNSEYCKYFYILSVIQFSVGMFTLFSLLFLLSIGTKKMTTASAVSIFMGTIAYFVLYFQSRLLHSTCLRSSKESLCGSSTPSSKIKDAYSN